MSPPPSPTPPSKPAALQHLAQVRDNYRLYQELKSSGTHLDWAVTVLFYTVLRLVEAYLAETSPAVAHGYRTHAQRDVVVYQRIRSIYSEYDFLHTRSTWARYHVDKPKPTSELVQQYETQQFARIVGELRRLGISLVP
jgi:hypothetical protein